MTQEEECVSAGPGSKWSIITHAIYPVKNARASPPPTILNCFDVARRTLSGTSPRAPSVARKSGEQRAWRTRCPATRRRASFPACGAGAGAAAVGRGTPEAWLLVDCRSSFAFSTVLPSSSILRWRARGELYGER